MTRRHTGRTPHGKKTICPIANTLDVVGDRWTLIVVRDLMFLKKKRFAELLAAREGIPTNVLTDRLRRLERAGVVRKLPYQRRPVRYEYELTEKGVDLIDIMKEMIRWANRHVPGTPKPPPEFFENPRAVLPMPLRPKE